VAKLLSPEDFQQEPKLLSEEDFDDTPKLLSASDFEPEQKLLSADDFEAPEPEPQGFLETAGNAISKGFKDATRIFTPSGQQELLNDPETAGFAGAILGPISTLTGMGDSPIVETEKENRSRAAMAGIEYGGGDYAGRMMGPVTAEKVVGGGARMLATGGLGLSPLAMAGVESAVKAGDIAQNEPDAELSLANAGRVGVAGAATYLPIKGGQAVEGAIAQTGLGRLGGFLGNAGADLAMGTGAAVGQRVGEEALTGGEVTAGDFMPTTMDVVTGVPGAVAAGVGGMRSNAARNARLNEPVATPKRLQEVEGSILDQLYSEGATAANRGLNEHTNDQGQLLIEGPEVLTASGPKAGIALGLSPLRKGGTDGLQSGEVKGQTPSGSVALEPTTAREAVINSRGEQVELPGRPASPVNDSDPDIKHIEDAIVSSKGGIGINSKSGFVDRLRTELFDQFRPMQKLDQAAEKVSGVPLKAAESPYKAFRGLNRKIMSTVNTAMTKGLPSFGSREPSTPALREVLAPVHDKLKRFDALLAARRTPEMASRQDVLPFDPVRAARATEKITQDPNMVKALEDYDAFTDGGLRYAVESGFISQETVDAIKSKNQLYAPWERVDEDGNIRMGMSPSPGKRPDQPGSPLKRVTEAGSTKKLASPLETSIKNLAQLVSAAEKNAAKMKMVDVATKTPELEIFAKPIDKDMAAKLSPSEVMVVKRNGEPEFYRVDPEIRKTLDGMTAQETDAFDKFMQVTANAFRGSVTLDPPFAINNFLRDMFQQSIISRSSKSGIPGSNQIRGIGILATKKGRDTWKEWHDSAANQAIEYGAIMDRRGLIEDMSRQAGITRSVEFAKEAINPMNWPKLIARAPGNAVRGLNKVMQTAESAGRVGEYHRVKNQSLKKGMTNAEARSEAEFESVDLGDFGMAGRNHKIQTARKWIPFFGSSLSFGYREAGALKSPKTWVKAGAALGGMELLNFYVNHDDPDYWNLPDDQRRRYWHFPKGDGQFWALSKPVGLISALFTAPMQYAMDKYVAGDDEADLVGMAEHMFESMLPPEAPQGLKTIAELNIGDAGYSMFYDRPIVNRELQGLPTEMQYTERTSLTARHLGKGLSKLGLGASPQKIDYAISSGMGPGVRRLVETAVDPAIAKFTGEEVPGQSAGVSLTKRNLFFPEDKGSEAVDRFYTKLDEMERIAAGNKKHGGEAEVDMATLKQMRKSADRLSQWRKDLKDAKTDEEQRRIKREMSYEVKNFVSMPSVFNKYDYNLPNQRNR